LTLAYHGTSTHLVVVDLRPLAGSGSHSLKGDAAARILDTCGLICNKNTLPGDASATEANGLRFGTTWVSQLGMDPPAMDSLAATIHHVLTHIQPFGYSGLRLEGSADQLRPRTQPRGKIDHGVMQDARASVQQLLQQFSPVAATPPRQRPAGQRPALSLDWPADQRPAGSIWLAGAAQTLGVLEIIGERAKPFLQAISATDVLSLPADLPARLALRDPRGSLLACALLTRLAADALGQDRFLMAVPHPQLEKVAAWLRDLSEGYVVFGGPDILAKVDGPVVVEPVTHSGDEQQAALLLEGGPALSVVQDTLSVGEKWGEGQWRDGQWANTPIGLTWFAGHPSSQPVFVLRLPQEAVPEAVRLIQAAARQHESALALCEPAPAQADLGDPGKPFWIGMAASPSSPLPRDSKPAFQPPSPTEALQRTPLFDEHRRHGAKMTAFAGWEMPLWYTRISEEYGAVRQQAALFDLAHMGILEITGEDAVWYLDAVTTNYIPALKVGQGAYSFILTPDGAVLDDCYLYRPARQRYWLVANAANAARVKAWLQAVSADQHAIEPDRPAARGDVFQEFDLVVARTGYTGERIGFELYVHPDCAVDLWRCLLRLGEPHGLRPAGLGARDTARIEAGFPLHGHELAGPSRISPLGAGYGAFVKFHKLFFIGRSALLQLESQRQHTLVRFQINLKGQKVSRPGNPVVSAEGQHLGVVTSSTVLRDRQVGMAYIRTSHAVEGAAIGIYALGEKTAEAGGSTLSGAPQPGARRPPLLPATIVSRWHSPA
jgi:glycine cleavage system aminomethyltransferase T